MFSFNSLKSFFKHSSPLLRTIAVVACGFLFNQSWTMSEHGEHLAALIMTALAVISAFAAVHGWSGVSQHPTASRVLKWIVFFGAAVWGIYSAIVIWRNKGINSWTNLKWQDVVVIQAYALASWRWLAIIVIAIFAFLIGRSTRNPIEIEAETQALRKPDLEKSLADNLRGCQDEWLHDKLKTDKERIKDFVWVAAIFYRPDFQKSQPRIDFVFWVINNSLFDIVISMDGGYILFGDDNEHFHFEPKFIAQNPARCRSRDTTNFVIQQAVTQDEITNCFKETDNTRISFGNLRINFYGTEQFPELVSTSLDVNHYLFTDKHEWQNPNCPKFLSGLPEQSSSQAELEKTLIKERANFSNIHKKLENDLIKKESQIAELTHINIPQDIDVSVRVRFDKLLSDAKLDFEIHVFNGSPRSIAFECDLYQNNVQGFIVAGDFPLPTKPKLANVHRFDAPNRLTVLTLEQTITLEMANGFQQSLDNGDHLQFLFTELSIYMRVEGMDEQQKLPLWGGVDCWKAICSNKVITGKAVWKLP